MLKPPVPPIYQTENKQTLSRNLSRRHVQMISIGGAIGTGLFMGTGRSIAIAGPSVILAYLIIGIMLFFVLRAMGELLLSSDQFTSFTDFSAGLLGSWAGFFMGWTYWFCWIITCIAEMTAITRYIQFWWPVCPAWVIALSCVLMFLLLNILAVRWFGEIEFWFAMVKILAIVGLIICGLLLISINYSSATDSVAALHNLWSHGGFFPHGIGGFLEGLQISVFAFVGIELVGAIAAEARQPEKILPKAINHIPIRFIIFYALSVLVILCVTPWDRFSPESSPFVAMFTLIGLPAAAAVLNFVVLTSACSSSNSGVFSTSRMLYGMANQGVASPQFKKLSSHYVPVRGLLFSCLCLSVGVLFIYFVPDVMKVFAILTTIASILFMFIWTMIMVCYLVYRRKCPQLHQNSSFKMPAGKLMSWVVILFFAFILGLLTLDIETRQALLATPCWFVLLTGAWQLKKHSQAKRDST